MRKLALHGMFAAVVCFQVTHAQTFKMNAGEDEVTLWRFSSNQREQIKESTVIGIGDTLFTSADQEVSIQLESESRLLVKGPGVVSFSGSSSKLEIHLEDGQVFLDRKQPHALEGLSITVKGFNFTPVGTAAAVRTTRQGLPTAAVLRGKVQMVSPSGESLTVGARQFATVDASGKLTTGALNEKGLAQLESWSGIKAEEEKPEPLAETTKQASTEQASAQEAATTQTPAEATLNAPVKTDKTTAKAAKGSKKTSPALQPATTSKPGLSKTGKNEDTESEAAPTDAPSTPTSSSPQYELGAGMVTVDGEQWTRVALGIDVPIWKFGVFLDLELFMDADNQFSNKGWDFKDNWAEALTRKIRYIRFGHEEDPLFVKFGGLSNVTMGYGIIMDRFTNMLRYPDEKLLGLQFYLNDISPLGFYVQSVISDFAESKDQGGVGALRLAFTPLKSSEIPLLKGLTLGGTYALDRNVHAPAAKWKMSNTQAFIQALQDDGLLDSRMKQHIKTNLELDADEQLRTVAQEDSIRSSVRPFDITGLDAGLPIIRSSLLKLDLYGQVASRTDDEGWGMGAPGVWVKLWKLWGNLEYRHIEGKFTPGFFDQYYLNERLSRATLESKADYLPEVSLDGVYGRVGADLSGLITVEGSYQYLLGKKDKDQRYEITGTLGEQIVSRIPKVNLAEIYLRNSNIGLSSKYDEEGYVISGQKAGKFDRSEFMYWGYRAGFEISPGASLVWDYRYGWKVDNNKLVSDNHMSLQTALTF